MEKEFIVPCDKEHELLRKLARETPLKQVYYASDSERVLGAIYRTDQLDLPDSYFLDILNKSRDELAEISQERRFHHAAENGFFNAAYLDKRFEDTLRFYRLEDPTDMLTGELKKSAFMLTGELISNGTGLLRSLHRYSPKSPSLQIYIDIPVPYSQNEHDNFKKNRIYESTNLITGSEYGELEQLWKRRDDKGFLQAIIDSMHQFSIVKLSSTDSRLFSKHLELQALWQYPPCSPKELIERVEHIIEKTTFEPNITPAFTNRFKKEPAENISLDRDGYDGWLQHPNPSDEV